MTNVSSPGDQVWGLFHFAHVGTFIKKPEASTAMTNDLSFPHNHTCAMGGDGGGHTIRLTFPLVSPPP